MGGEYTGPLHLPYPGQVQENNSSILDSFERPANWPAEFAASEDLIPASQIRWTQNSVKWHTKGGIDLDTLAGDIGSQGFKGAINVIEVDGKLYSLDNRRLTVAKMLGIDVPVNRLDINNPGVFREFIRKFTTNTDGLSIRIRGPNLNIDADGNIIK